MKLAGHGHIEMALMQEACDSRPDLMDNKGRQYAMLGAVLVFVDQMERELGVKLEQADFFNICAKMAAAKRRVAEAFGVGQGELVLDIVREEACEELHARVYYEEIQHALEAVNKYMYEEVPDVSVASCIDVDNASKYFDDAGELLKYEFSITSDEHVKGRYATKIGMTDLLMYQALQRVSLPTAEEAQAKKRRRRFLLF